MSSEAIGSRRYQVDQPQLTDSLEAIRPEILTYHHQGTGPITEQEGYDNQEVIPPKTGARNSSRDKAQYNKESGQYYQSNASTHDTRSIIGFQVYSRWRYKRSHNYDVVWLSESRRVGDLDVVELVREWVHHQYNCRGTKKEAENI